MARRARSTGEHFDRELADLPHDLRRREFMGRIEAVLFAYPGSVPREELLRVVASDCSIDQLIDDIRQELKSRPYDISFVAGGYRIQTKARYADVLRAMVPQRTPQLSNSDVQILAGVAYFQPVTRRQLCDILSRDIGRDTLARLKATELITNGPRSPTPGAPATYVTTKGFLELYGLASLNDLPEFEEMQADGFLEKPDIGDDLRAVLGIEDNDPEHEEEEDD